MNTINDTGGIVIRSGQPTRSFIYVAGVVLPDDSARFEPFEVITTTEDIETRSKGGSLTLTVESSVPGLTTERQFEPSILSVGNKEAPRPFGLFVPYDRSVARIVLRRGSKLLGERRASAHTPYVSLAPMTETSVKGKRSLSWRASDPGQVALTFSVWYSSDGGERWLPLAVGLRSTAVEIDFDRLTPSSNGLLRVLASNGLNTTEVRSESLRVGSAP